MSTSAINEQQYPFTWLDEVIEVSLNPAKTDIKSISATQLQQISEQLPAEINRILNAIKIQAFGLYISDQLKVVAGHYDQAIRLLYLQALENQRQYPKTGNLSKVGQEIILALEQLNLNLRNRYSEYLPEVGNAEESSIIEKIVCALSADQLGIVLKAAFDVKVIVGNSFRRVCKAIAPYLSTVWKKELSWDTIRSNAGRPELRDKEVAINALEKMIEAIRGYQ